MATNTSQKSGASAFSGFMTPFVTEAFKGFDGVGFDAARKANEAWMHAAMDMNREVLEFMSERLRRDMQTTQNLLECKNGMDAMKVQADFVETAFKTYGEEAVRLCQIAADAAKDVFEPIRTDAAKPNGKARPPRTA